MSLLRILCLLVALWPGVVSAQSLLPPPAQSVDETNEPRPALLVADAIVVTPDNELIADGNVEVLYQGQTFTASRIVYRQDTDELVLQGPLRVIQDDGTVITAEEGEVDAGLENGILRGARLVLDQQLQMAAVQLARAEGRYSVLSKAAVTSCRVCGDTGAPLWEIRARRIIHDDLEKQIYLDGAQLRVVDVPVFYIPRLRFPDPSLKRARGFLFPTLRSTTKLGLGVKVPYFIPLGDHKDLTLTPYISPKTTTLEFRYRQAFAKGEILFNGAVTEDSLRSGETRGYLFGEGAFDLPRNYKLTFDVEVTTDEAYLKDYGFSKKTRLDSAISASRVSRDRLTTISLTHYNTLLDGEDNATQPAFVFDTLHRQRFRPSLGGEVQVSAALHGHYRYSSADVTGRDVYRAHAAALWREDWVTGAGLHFTAQTGLDVDAVRTLGDSTVASEDSVVTPHVMTRLRLPMVAAGASGARYTLEPVVQLSFVGGDRLETANDESLRNELDEGNLLSLSRFSAQDRRERGWATAAGMRWAMVSPSGWRTGLTVGRVLREETRDAFSTTSGLKDADSDWLVAARIGNGTGLDFIARAMMDDDSDIHRAEARGIWSNNRLDLSASFLRLPSDNDEDRSELVSEWGFDGRYRLSRHWTASARWQYDLARDRSSDGAIGFEYQNECVVARFEADRDFTDSDNLDPTTSFELTVELKGFTTGGDAGGYRRSCSN